MYVQKQKFKSKHFTNASYIHVYSVRYLQCYWLIVYKISWTHKELDVSFLLFFDDSLNKMNIKKLSTV